VVGWQRRICKVGQDILPLRILGGEVVVGVCEGLCISALCVQGGGRVAAGDDANGYSLVQM